MGIFERYLSLWVTAAILIGLALGTVFPPLFELFSTLEFAKVNIPIAIFIWVMIFPMMVQVDFSAIKKVKETPQGIWLTVIVNWLIKPFTMAALAWLFFAVLFKGLVDANTAKEYIAGMILLGVAPCTAMVFVWSHLTQGDANYTLVQVAINDLIMIFAFAPIAALLLGMSNITVPWDTLMMSVVLYVILPLLAGILVRKALLKNNDESKLTAFLNKTKPLSIMGLLATVGLLFAFQAKTILNNPLAIVLIAIPLLIQSYSIFFVTYKAAQKLNLPHRIASPASMIGTSNFFELAVAVAISLFGLNSGAALATVVGVLVEVPVMLSLVHYANKTRAQFNN